MGVLFMKGTKRELLNRLGIPYGWLCVEEAQTAQVWTMQQARELLRDGIEKEFFSADEAQIAEGVIVSTGILEDLSAVMEKARQFKLPKGFLPAFDFKVCDDTECGLPLPHGRICNHDGENMPDDEAIRTMYEGLNKCVTGVIAGAIIVLDAVGLYQQMFKAGLPLDKDDFERRYEALPEETRRKFEEAQSRPRVQVVDIGNLSDLLGGGSIAGTQMPLDQAVRLALGLRKK